MEKGSYIDLKCSGRWKVIERLLVEGKQRKRRSQTWKIVEGGMFGVNTGTEEHTRTKGVRLGGYSE